MKGEVDEIDALGTGLASELAKLLSDNQRLDNAFQELNRSSIVSKYAEDTYKLDESVSRRVRAHFSPQDDLFWTLQALIVAYRAVPWKYLEPS
jgi:hypothetical protein